MGKRRTSKNGVCPMDTVCLGNAISIKTSTYAKKIGSVGYKAISEGRGVFKGTIGVAIMDVRRADIELNEFMDSAALTRLKVKLRIAEPFEVLVPESFHERSTNAILTEMIRSSLPNATVTNIHRRFFNHSRGAELVTLLANMEVSNCDSSVLKK
ncbi:unnamed protein product [Nippostrongylus brasiliensis]|uniref:MutS protein homolog him-14 (inferred by orthology to a C. elegans protein) n=1 Tax=Nippostrongylus brasiliensis TaxID=27835 RepID=A0A0N4Y3M9_NIPBR|nr:unnamed protein product [Nippostrongylus brasiliensis]